MTVDMLDRKVFLICYYASRGGVSYTSPRGIAINNMLSDYHEMLHTGRGRSLVERQVSELFVERSSVSKKLVTPKRISVQVGSGEDDRQKLLMKTKEEAVEATLKLANDHKIQEKVTNDQLMKMMIQMKEQMDLMSTSKAEEIEQVAMELKNQGHNIGEATKLTKKTFEEIRNMDQSNLSTSSWFVGKMAAAFKGLFISIPVGGAKIGFNAVRKIVHKTLIYPLEVVVDFYSRKIAFIVGHVYVIVIAGALYYIYLQVSEDERTNKLCEDNPNQFMCSESERMFVRGIYETVKVPVDIGLDITKQVYDVSLRSSAHGMDLLFNDLWESGETYFSAISEGIKTYVAGTLKSMLPGSGWLF